jgi:hypothetical protein
MGAQNGGCSVFTSAEEIARRWWLEDDPIARPRASARAGRQRCRLRPAPARSCATCFAQLSGPLGRRREYGLRAGSARLARPARRTLAASRHGTRPVTAASSNGRRTRPFEGRSFVIDVLARPHCGGRLRLTATLHEPAVIRKLLALLGWLAQGRAPARAARALIGSARARWTPSCLRGEAPSMLLRPGPPGYMLATCWLTAAVCRHRMPLSQAGALGARRGS